jgi:hypothetical protein
MSGDKPIEKTVHHVRRLVQGATGTNTINIYHPFEMAPKAAAEDPGHTVVAFRAESEPVHVHAKMKAAGDTPRFRAVYRPPEPVALSGVRFSAEDPSAAMRARTTVKSESESSHVEARFNAAEARNHEPPEVGARFSLPLPSGEMRTKLSAETEEPGQTTARMGSKVETSTVIPRTRITENVTKVESKTPSPPPPQRAKVSNKPRT